MTPLDVGKLSFVGESLKLLREEVKNEAAVIGFVGKGALQICVFA